MTSIFRPVFALSVIAAALAVAGCASSAAPGKPNPVVDAASKAIGNLRADDDMLAVLNAQASLDPKAIEKLDVPTARQQPTVADGVNVLLRQQGRSTRPEDLVPGA